MRCKTLPLLMLTAMLLLAQQSYGAIIRVKWDSTTDGPGTTWGNAYHSVIAGMNATVSGDEVWVARGTYVGCITLKSGVGLYGGFAGTESARAERDWNANATVLDGNNLGTVVIVQNGATTATTISGFTIRNGNGSGAGIRCGGASPVISNNTITGNAASFYGGAIMCAVSSATITNNLILSNKSGRAGGGIYCSGGSPIITNNTIAQNSATTGGAIYRTSSSSPIISNNIVASNSSGVSVNTGSPA